MLGRTFHLCSDLRQLVEREVPRADLDVLRTYSPRILGSHREEIGLAGGSATQAASEQQKQVARLGSGEDKEWESVERDKRTGAEMNKKRQALANTQALVEAYPNKNYVADAKGGQLLHRVLSSIFSPCLRGRKREDYPQVLLVFSFHHRHVQTRFGSRRLLYPFD